jgi:DNA-binding HxlR family transcriptional regulator
VLTLCYVVSKRNLLAMRKHMAQLAAAQKNAPSSAQVAAGKPTVSVYSACCPTRMVLDHVADKWAGLVLMLLADGPIRFNELRRRVDGISPKVLSQVLKRLERDGLLTRHVFPTVPVTVEYRITPLGRTLHAAIEPLVRWAEEHSDEVLSAQAAFGKAA